VRTLPILLWVSIKLAYLPQEVVTIFVSLIYAVSNKTSSALTNEVVATLVPVLVWDT